jgi:hypothetical protein
MKRVFVVLALPLMAPLAEGQGAPAGRVSVAIIEAESAPVERTRKVAALVRAELERYTTREQLHVVPRKDFMSICDITCPVRWTPRDLREAAKLLRADVMVELTTSVQGREVTTQALALRPYITGVDTLPPARDVADSGVARKLAEQLSEMLFRVSEQKLDSARGAARVVSVPKNAFLVDLMRQLASESPLGDLRRRATAVDDVEVRAWGGFGLTGTAGVVLRRERGTWRGWLAEIVSCRADVAIPIADTASATTVAGFVARARRKCDATIGDVRNGAQVYNADTLAITALTADSHTIQRAWDAAVQEGLLTLPPDVARKWLMMDGFTYVIEVRRGAEYRASSIEQLEKPEVPADAQVKNVYDALIRLVRP